MGLSVLTVVSYLGFYGFKVPQQTVMFTLQKCYKSRNQKGTDGFPGCIVQLDIQEKAGFKFSATNLRKWHNCKK